MLKTILDKLDSYEDKLHIYYKNQKLENIININNIDEIKRMINDLLDYTS
jgi:predicted DNA-binding protein YlxM (UPF0122 family)